jgi:hypothetical protein
MTAETQGLWHLVGCYYVPVNLCSRDGSGLDTAHLVTIIMALWAFLINCFGRDECLLVIPTSFIAQLFLAVSRYLVGFCHVF